MRKFAEFLASIQALLPCCVISVATNANDSLFRIEVEWHIGSERRAYRAVVWLQILEDQAEMFFAKVLRDIKRELAK